MNKSSRRATPVDNLRDRQIRFDIACRAKNGELVNVEMSLNPDPFEPVRLEFHAGKLFTGQDIRGTDKTYDDLNYAYQIALLAKERFFTDESAFHTFEYYDPAHGVSLNGRSRITTVELSKLDRVVEKPIGAMNAREHWAIFFRYLTDKGKRGKINELIASEEGIAMASEVLIGRRGPYPGACSGKFSIPENGITRFSDRGMDLANSINFLSNEDTQELAPGFFMSISKFMMLCQVLFWRGRREPGSLLRLLQYFHHKG
ncbi:MAG: Rpn family recombination-promoting nuclease/putative transposase [Treponema sp.]|jgi:hypothetical protein|nr:Rpn family recombination-promoting nuclease/putative transposase [Treponema sp.]